MLQMQNRPVPEEIRARNERMLMLTADYLRRSPGWISREMVDEIAGCGVDRETAYRLLFAGALNLHPETDREDRILEKEYLPEMIRREDPVQYECEPYFLLLREREFREGSWILSRDSYAAYEAFVRDDLVRFPDGRILPQIGFFEREFHYPAVYEAGRMWMSLTPNEIHTMKGPAEEAFGEVLIFGLGIGYFPFLCLNNPNVRTVTVVERETNCIRLFRDHLQPLIPDGGRILLVEEDAFSYAENQFRPGKYDFVFTDLWMDVSDGLELSGKMKRLEGRMPGAVYRYWLEKSMACYL